MWTGSARTRQSGCAYSPPPIPSLPPPRSQKLRESGGQRRLPVIGICEPGRGDLPEQHDRDHPRTPAAPRTTPLPRPRPLVTAIDRSGNHHTRCAAQRPPAEGSLPAPPPSSPECAGGQNSDPAASRPSSPPVTTGESRHVSIAGAGLAGLAELMHACADRPPGAADAPVIAAAERLKLTGAATLDLRHFTAVHPPTHSRPEPPATDADRAARQAPDRAA